MSLKILSFLKRRWFWLLLFFPLLYLIAATSLYSDPILIDDGDVDTLIEVIDDANDNCGTQDPVVIQLAAAGTYTLTEVYEDFNGATGLPAIRCTLTILGNDATITRDALADPFRLLAVTSIGDLSLFDLTLTNGAANAGGALLNAAGSLSLSGVTIDDNTATGGGGIFNDVGPLTIISSTLSNNTASSQGGALLLNSGTLHISFSRIEQNAGSSGGGLFMVGNDSKRIEWSEVIDNQATSEGGGIFIQSSVTTTLSNVLLSDNSVGSGVGGGVFNQGPIIITDHSILSDNSALYGGGISISSGTLDMDDSRVENNQSGFGAGINIGNAEVTVIDSALLSNDASQNNGGGAFLMGSTSVLTISGSCIATNTVGSGSGTGIANGGGSATATGNWWGASGGANTSGAQTTLGTVTTSSHLSSAPASCTITANPTPTPTPSPTPTVPICEGFSLLEEEECPPTLGDFGIVAEECDLTERNAILAGTIDTAEALKSPFGGDPASDTFQRVMYFAPRAGIRFECSANGTAVCDTESFPEEPDHGLQAIIRCGSEIQLTQYTVVHEYGHVFMGRMGGTDPNSSYYRLIEQPAVTLAPSATPGTLGPLYDSANFIVFGPRKDPDTNEDDWVRGGRGWGSAASTPPAVPCNFQQNAYTVNDWEVPLTLTPTLTPPAPQYERGEAAADMFLNWVYRVQDLGGFLNEDQRFTHDCTSIPPTDAGNPGDARYNYMETIVMPTLSTRVPTATATP